MSDHEDPSQVNGCASANIVDDCRDEPDIVDALCLGVAATVSFKKGTPLTMGEKYVGSEGWENWIFCELPGQEGGWVPLQIIEIIAGKTACAREDYTARELNVREGGLLLGERVLNGWIWCEKSSGSESGWVPLENLKEVQR